MVPYRRKESIQYKKNNVPTTVELSWNDSCKTASLIYQKVSNISRKLFEWQQVKPLLHDSTERDKKDGQKQAK